MTTESQTESQPDVIVIGAGAAGLAAARALTRAGRAVALIEARDRIGGRLLTVHVPGSLVPIELGASFVHGRPPETMALAQAAGATLYALGGESVTRFGADEASQEGEDDDDDGEEEEEDENPILSAVARWQGPDLSLDAFIATQGRGPAWEAAAPWTRRYVAGFDAADPARVSVRWLAETERAEERVESDRQFFLLDGYDHLMAQLLSECDPLRLTLRLGVVAERVAWAPGRATVHLRSAAGEPLAPISAARVVITAPLGVLAMPPEKPGALRVDPQPPELARLLEGAVMGHVARVVLRLRERFWDRMTPGPFHHPRLSFLLSRHPVMPTWWTNYPLLTPLLTGWVGGSFAEPLVARADGEIIAAATQAIAEITGLSRSEMDALVEEGYVHNWSRDPYARGAYSYVTVGGMEHVEAIARPIAQTLYFAGEATSVTGRTGTVDGALATGERAARQIIG